MKSKSVVQIRAMGGGMMDVPCYHQWSLDVGGTKFNFALHPKAGTIKGLQRPLAISECGTGFDVKAVLLHPNSRNPLTENSVKNMTSDQVKRLARAALHRLIFKQVGPINFLQAMITAQMRVSGLTMDISKIESQLAQLEAGAATPGEYVPTPEEVSQALADADEMNKNMRTYGTIDAPKVVEGHAEPCAACGGSKVLTLTDKDHEGRSIEIACTECIPGRVNIFTEADLPSLRHQREQLQLQVDQHGTMTGDTTESAYEDASEQIAELDHIIKSLERKPCSTTK